MGRAGVCMCVRHVIKRNKQMYVTHPHTHRHTYIKLPY